MASYRVVGESRVVPIVDCSNRNTLDNFNSHSYGAEDSYGVVGENRVVTIDILPTHVPLLNFSEFVNFLYFFLFLFSIFYRHYYRPRKSVPAWIFIIIISIIIFIIIISIIIIIITSTTNIITSSPAYS
jgi:hypothetical protein